MAGRQQGTPKGWLFLPDVVSTLEPEKAISGWGLLAHHPVEGGPDPHATSRTLVSTMVA
jgi:hypothetical protein